MSDPWISELWRLGGLLAAMLLLGLLLGNLWLFLALTLLLYLIWHLYNLYRFERWLRHGKKSAPPEVPGLWGEVFYQFYRLQQRKRKRKRKLANMLRRFRESTSAMPDAIVVLNPNQEVEWFNEAALEMLGLQSSQDIGQRIVNLLRSPQFLEYLQRSREQDSTQSVMIPSPLNPQALLRLHLVPYAKRRCLLIARDITQLQRLEQIRRDFVANVSHELRTPLTVIHGFIETLRDSGDACATQWQRPLLLMAQQTLRMENLVNDLLLLSRLESESAPAKLEPVAVARLLANICEDARALSGDQAHNISLQADESLQIHGVSEELRSAFSNLVFNAVRYTPAGGAIEIRWWQEAGGARLSVKDTGEGIAAHHIPRLTERFYRIDIGRSRNQGGTGLGLAIVKHVLNRHHAQLQVDSKIGVGSTFRCEFPAAAIVGSPPPS
jgi:two-component system phosphate regulon sensor histidine kinase PhoR